MKTWELLIGFIAIASGMLGQVKMVAAWFKGLFIVTISVDEAIARILCDEMNAQGRVVSASQSRLFTSTRAYVKPLKTNSHIVWEEYIGTSRTFWFKGRPIWYAKQDKPKSPWHAHGFSFIRGTVDWEGLITQAIKRSGSNPDNWMKDSGSSIVTRSKRFQVTYHFGASFSGLPKEGATQDDNSSTTAKHFTNEFVPSGSTKLIGWRPEDIGRDAKPITYDTMSLSPELIDLQEEIRRFMDLREWYSERGISHKRGYLFHGKPGTGKTSFARITAQAHDLPVHVFDLATMSNQELKKAWMAMAKSAPCMAVIEDIDRVFKGDQNCATAQSLMNSGGCTFDCLLNCIDGIDQVQGIILVVSTNHPDLVDPALKARAGRIDRQVEFLPLEFEGRVKMARRILGDIPEALELAERTGTIPAADFQEMCCREAVRMLYDEKKGPEMGPFRNAP